MLYSVALKPALGGALLIIGVAALLGLASTVLAWGHDRALDQAE